jgi:hypothetical protein
VAETFAKESFGALFPGSKTKQVCQVLKILGDVYETRLRPFVPGDLADCIARHVVDRDLFMEEPGAELLSIMLKYSPVRAAFSAELRKLPMKATETQRAWRLWKALRGTVREMSKPKHQPKLHCGASIGGYTSSIILDGWPSCNVRALLSQLSRANT